MQLYFTLFVFLAGSWVQDGKASKCNLSVLDRVLELYQKRGVPSGILANSIRLSPDVEVATTDGYFSNQQNISCISSSWSADGVFTSTFVYINDETLTVTGKAVTELPGQTYDAETKTRRYHIPTGPLVNAFYKCQEEGEEGSAEGLVKVWSGYKTSDLETAIRELEYVLGAKLSQRFPDTCDL